MKSEMCFVQNTLKFMRPDPWYRFLVPFFHYNVFKGHLRNTTLTSLPPISPCSKDSFNKRQIGNGRL